MLSRLTAVACTVAVCALATGASARPFHFAGVPAAGVTASAPTTGTMLISLKPTPTTTWTLYADGRILWQKWTTAGEATVVPAGERRLDTGVVQQRLTLKGVQLIRSKIVSTGLFEHNLMLDLGGHGTWVFDQVRRGGRIVSVQGVSLAAQPHFRWATAAQRHALAWIAGFVADPAKWIPTSAWADRQIRAFVPARYLIAVDRSYPDLSKLPSRVREMLLQYRALRRYGCQILTTGETRALLQTFAEARISPDENQADMIAFDLPGSGSTVIRPPSDLHLSPALPDDRC